MSGPSVSATPCPRCGCHVVKHFECGCGEVHKDHCANCGRWTSLAPNEHVKLAPSDERCALGATPHDHHPEDTAGHVRAQALDGLGQAVADATPRPLRGLAGGLAVACLARGMGVSNRAAVVAGVVAGAVIHSRRPRRSQ